MPGRKTVVGLALLGAGFYFGVWPFIVGGPRMEAFCGSLSSGLPAAELNSRASTRGYRISVLDGGRRLLVHEPASMGRFTCEVEVHDGQVKAARYGFND